MLDEFNIFKDHSNKYLCNAWVATAIVGSAVVGAGATLFGANKAAKTQTDAASLGAATALHMYDTTRSDLAPYREAGAKATTELQDRMPFLTSPIDVTKEISDPTSTIGKAYEFQRTQGLRAVTNSSAKRGLGVSGAAYKGAADFSKGLIDTTYPTLFSMENTNRTNAYERLKGLITIGENAGAQTGAAGTSAATTAAGAQIGAGNAQAAAANLTGSAISKASGDIGGYFAYKGLYGNGGGGGTPNYQTGLNYDPAGNAVATPVYG